MPGLAFAYATSSATDFAGTSACAARTMMLAQALVSGAKSFTLWDYLDWINAVIVFAMDGEQTGFILLQRANGKQYRLL